MSQMKIYWCTWMSAQSFFHYRITFGLTSASVAPDANKLGCSVFQSRPRTVPLCRSVLNIEALQWVREMNVLGAAFRMINANEPHSSVSPARILAGSHSPSSPLSIPAASTPSGLPSLGVFHERQLNLLHRETEIQLAASTSSIRL